MKSFVIPALTALVVSLSSIIAIELVTDGHKRDLSDPSLGKPEDADNTTQALDVMREELAIVARKLAAVESLVEKYRHSAELIPVKELLDRLSNAERALESLTSSEGNIPIEDTHRNQAFAEKVASFEVTSRPSTESNADEQFITHQGKSIHEFVPILDDALHKLETLSVEGMDCRDTICKVTYTKIPSESGEVSEYDAVDPVDALSMGMVGQTVEVRYALDQDGRDIMLISLR